MIIQNESENRIYWVDDYGDKASLMSFVRDERDLHCDESIDQLWTSEMTLPDLDSLIKEGIPMGKVIRVNKRHQHYENWSGALATITKTHKRINILGLGDVGSTMALALCLYGKGCVSEIGIYDLDQNRISRFEQELNQIAEPLQDELPKVVILTLETLFDCDLFAFTASVGVPPVSVTEGDVRVIQFEGNSKLVGHYARMAVERNFTGIFAIVSDPVDQLCRYAFESSNTNDMGKWVGRGLVPEQIRGYGLGVMNGRAAYFARQENLDFSISGRVYGPHGKGLVVANDWRKGCFDEALSEKWTAATITANLKMRALGYKPYIAPAVASGAISLIKTLQGEKHYSCISFNGFYYGCLNQRVGTINLPERLDSDSKLIEKIKYSAEELENQWLSLR